MVTTGMYWKYKENIKDYRYVSRNVKVQEMLYSMLKQFLDNNTRESTQWWDLALQESERLKKLITKQHDRS